MKRFPQTILPTAVIPWTDSYKFDEERFRKQIRQFVQEGIKHLYVFGTAGEGHAVTEQQYTEIVSVFADEMKAPELHPMVGLLSLSLPTMHERLRIAYEQGIRDFQFVLPSWGALTDSELFSFFHSLCDPYSDCRFLHYNLLRSKRLVTPEEYRRLAEEIPNFVGAKYTSNDLMVIHKLLDPASPLQFFLGELGFGYANTIGRECGLLSSISNIHLKHAWSFFDAAVGQDSAKAFRYMDQYHQVLTAIMAAMGTSKMDGAYDKVLARMMDGEFPLSLLPPYEAATIAEFENFRASVKTILPDWDFSASEAGV